MKVRNFRCFKDEIQVDFDNITAIIGKNDAGKSTILEALDIFLNDSKIDQNDASKNGDPADLTIICEFDELPEEIILDDSSPTKFEDEYLVNADGRLEIHKKYSGNLVSPKCKSIEALCIHPSVENANDILQLKNRELKRRFDELGLDDTDVDRRSNVQLRAAIREGVAELNPTSTLIPLNDNNGKTIWGELKKSLPLYALFKSDRQSTDQDSEAQDPLKMAVREAIREKETELGDISDYVVAKVKEITDMTLEKIQEMDPELATQLNPQFPKAKWAGLFKPSLTSDDDIPINKRGSGVKRLILLNFFRAKAELIAREKDHSSVIYAIEEPETSQHPNNQRMLIRVLSDLSSSAQVIITTHTPMLARALPDNNLRYIHINVDKTREILTGGEGVNEQFAKSLGVLPDNNVKVFVGVEGPNDIKFLNSISKALLGDGADIPDLAQMEIDGELIYFPFGGSNLALWASRLQGLNRPEFHLCDRDCGLLDRPQYQDHVDAVNLRDSCKASVTTKREIENYLHFQTINEAYRAIGIELALTTNYDDVPVEIARKVHELDPRANPWDTLSEGRIGSKASKVKVRLCEFATRYMTIALLSEIDPSDDLLGWFSDIRELCEGIE